MQTLLENPLLFALVLVVPVLVLVTPFRIGWLVAIAVFFWADSSMPGVEFARRPWVRFGALLLVVLHGAVRLRGRGRGEVPPAPLQFLFVLCLVSLLWADPFDYSAASAVFLALLMTLLFAFVARLAFTPDAAARAIRRITLVVLALFLIGLVPYWRSASLFVEGTGRLRGFFNNPNGLGITSALIAPFVAVHASRVDGRSRLLGWALVALFAGLAFLAGSRTGFGGVVAGVSVALFIRHPSKYLAGVAAVGILAGAATLARSDIDLEEGATGNLIRGQTISRLSGRLDRWVAGLEMWQESPFLGKGYMTSRRIQFVEVRDDGSEAGPDTAGQGVNFHSQHVETLVDLGLLGEVLLLALGVTLARRGRRLAHVTSDPTAAALGAAYVGTLTAAALDSFFHNWILTPGSPFALVFWSLTAIVLRVERDARRGVAPARPPVFSPAPEAVVA